MLISSSRWWASARGATHVGRSPKTMCTKPNNPLHRRNLATDKTPRQQHEKALVRPADDAKPSTPAKATTWGGSALELEPVSKERAAQAFKDATSLSSAITPPTGLATEARDDMVVNRFEYVENNLRPGAQVIVPGANGTAVAPVAVSQSSLAVATALVVMGGVAAAMYVKTQWNVSSGKELGDVLRAKGAARREAMESSGAVSLVRTVSQHADSTVKSNVDLIRKPSQQMGSTLQQTFQQVGRKGSAAPPTSGDPTTAPRKS